MAAAVTAKSEEKKSNAAQPRSDNHRGGDWEEAAGATAGLPLFLKAGNGNHESRPASEPPPPRAPVKIAEPVESPAGAVRPAALPAKLPAEGAVRSSVPVAATGRNGSGTQERSLDRGLGLKPPAAGTPGPPPEGGRKDLMQREVSAVTANPTIRAYSSAGGPTILAPPATPPTAAQQAARAKPAVPAPPHAPPSPARSTDRKPARTPVARVRREGLEKVAAKRRPAGRALDRAATGRRPRPARGQTAPVARARRGAPRTLGAARPAGSAAAMIPPAAPEALKAQIPQRPPTFEEFQETLQSRRSPAESRAQAQAFVARLRTDAEQEKGSLAAAATQHKAAIGADAEARAASVAALAAGHRSAIQSYFATTSAKIRQQGEQHKALVPPAVAADVLAAHTSGTEAAAAALEEAATRKTAITSYAQEQQSQPSVIAAQESARASSELETAAQECERAGQAEAARYPGEEDPKPKQRSAARQVGTESAADIRAKKPEIASDMQSRAAEFTGKYMEYAGAVIKQIDDALAQLVPALQQAATDTAASVGHTGEAALHSIEDRVRIDQEALSAARSQSLQQLNNAEQATVQQIHRQAGTMSAAIDDAHEGLALAIDRSVEETATVVSGQEVPHLPGIRDIVEGGRLKVRTTGATGRSHLGDLEASARENLSASHAAFEGTSGQVLGLARSTTAGITSRNANALTQALQSRAQQAGEMLANLRSRQTEMTQAVMAEIDRAAEKARGEMRGINDKFRDQTRKAADESIEKAKQPRTDTVETRAAEAAHHAGEAWYWGLLRAVGQLVVGLVILVVVALVVAAIAAAFGVILTAWTALMIAGAILLVIGLVVSLIHRAGQKELQGHPGEIILLALSDTIGVTGIIEGISGHDIVTDKELSDADRTERGVLGVVTLVTIVLGVRSAVKGPPGGVYWRPGGFEWPGFGEFFKGGWREYLPAAWEAVKEVAGEIYSGLRRGVKGVVDWVRKRYAELKPGPPETKPLPEPKPEPQARPPAAAGMPDDLVQVRNTLKSNEAVQQFDSRYQAITRQHPGSPTDVELQRFRAYLESLRTRNNGDLEKGLIDDFRKAHPEPKAPFGDAAGRLPELRTRVNAARAEIERIRSEHLDLAQAIERLLKDRFEPEEARLARMENGQLEATPDDVTSIDNNTQSVLAEVRSASTAPSGTKLSKKFKRPDGSTFEIDQVSPDGSHWVQVKNMEPFDTGSENFKDVSAQADRNLADAKLFPVNGKPPTIEFQFTKGVLEDVAGALQAKGIQVTGLILRRGQVVVPFVPSKRREEAEVGPR